jgi:NADH-ubiquinone oxidoreductase chain 5
LPAAMSAPTPVSSLVHSSTLVTAGVYLFIRFYYIFSKIVLGGVCLCVSLLTFFSAGLLACVENDMKKLVAISTLSQLGLIIFSLYLGNYFITFFHMVSHALFKSLLFLTCGFVILTRFSRQDMRLIGRKATIGKLIYIMLYTSILSLIGLFFLRGFFSKDMVVEIAFRENTPTVQLFIFIISCILSVMYRLKMLYESFMGAQNIFSSVSYIGLSGSGVAMLFLFFWSIFFGKIFFLFFFDGELVLLFF